MPIRDDSSPRTGSATFSPCGNYRLSLWRHWNNLYGSGYVNVIGLNPSTADADHDDPTIRRCVEFAKAWGFSGLCMTNLFAFRATSPKDMIAAADPVGQGNDDVLISIASGAGIVVAAWGVHGEHLQRAAWVRKNIPGLHLLKLTKGGHPQHPLYLPKTLRPVPWPKAA